jgi:hypothetical protein
VTAASSGVRRSERVLAIGALVLSVALVVALHLWAWSGWRATRPWSDGVRLVVAVVDREASTGPRSDLHRVTVLVPDGVRADGPQRRVRFDVDRATYDAAASGELEVEIDGTDPRRVRIPRNDEWTGRLLAVGLVDLFLVAAALQIRRSVRSDR